MARDCAVAHLKMILPFGSFNPKEGISTPVADNSNERKSCGILTIWAIAAINKCAEMHVSPISRTFFLRSIEDVFTTSVLTC